MCSLEDIRSMEEKLKEREDLLNKKEAEMKNEISFWKKRCLTVEETVEDIRVLDVVIMCSKTPRDGSPRLYLGTLLLMLVFLIIIMIMYSLIVCIPRVSSCYFLLNVI